MLVQELDGGMAARQTPGVQCDSCGAQSVEDEEHEERKEPETLTVADASTIERLHWCSNCCQNLCSNCVLVHSRLMATRSHRVVPLALRYCEFRGLPCAVHSDCTSDLFCWHCRQLVCINCTTSPDHRDHSCDDVALSAVRLRSVLLNDAASVDDLRRRCDELEADVTADKYNWLSSVQAADNEIKTAADKLRALVDRHCASLSDELVSMKQLRLKELQSRLEDLEQERSRLNSLWENIRVIVDSAADVQLLLSAGNLHQSVERCMADLTAVTSHGSFTSHQTVVFLPSVARSSDGGDGLLGRVEVVGGEARRTTDSDSGQTVGTHMKTSSRIPDGSRRMRRQHQTITQQAPATLCYRQLLATLKDRHLSVCGLAVVADHLYVCRSQSADVDVYNAGGTKYRPQRSIHVPGLTEPSDMTGTCGSGKAVAGLYISSESEGLVFKVTLMRTSADDVHTRWSTDDRPYAVSVMESKHVLVLSREAASVSILDDDGRQLRRLRLPASVLSPWSAVQVSTCAGDADGDLVVCHGDLTPDVDGHLRRGVSRLNWSTGAVTRRYEWVQQSGTDHDGCSSVMHMMPESDRGGGFLLADQCCDSVQRVDSGLTSHQSLLQTSSDMDDDLGVQQARRLCVDSERQRLVVGLHDGRVKVFANGCTVM